MLTTMTNLFIKAVFGLLFLVLVTPAGFLLRLCGIDFLERKIDPAAASYWKKRV